MNKLTDEVPMLGRIPLLGDLFQNRNDTTTKTELVIFLRPVVIKSASVDADYSKFRNNLPDQDFFQRVRQQQALEDTHMSLLLDARKKSQLSQGSNGSHSAI